jgi:polyhydroxyalkanoate synthesis regulator phasin
MKLVMATYQMGEKCKLCTKLETKWGRIRKEQDRIKRWKKEDRHGRKASIAAAEEIIDNLEREIADLNNRKYEQSQHLGW